jgi:hypothetical protein
LQGLTHPSRSARPRDRVLAHLRSSISGRPVPCPARDSTQRPLAAWPPPWMTASPGCAKIEGQVACSTTPVTRCPQRRAIPRRVGWKTPRRGGRCHPAHDRHRPRPAFRRSPRRRHIRPGRTGMRYISTTKRLPVRVRLQRAQSRLLAPGTRPHTLGGPDAPAHLRLTRTAERGRSAGDHHIGEQACAQARTIHAIRLL